jgi:SDR family mycofactocin-dependent oxidoreductase
VGKLDGKTAFITGAARGQGRSHAVRLAEEGADIIAVDLCDSVGSVAYAGATIEDLAETVKLVEDRDRRIVATVADVRDESALQSAFDAGRSALGDVDIVLANAGIMPIIGDQARAPQAWHDAIDIMLTGVLNTVEVAVPSMIEAGRGGSVVVTSSTAGLKGLFTTRRSAVRGALGYVAAKHGVVGLMRSYALSLAEYRIRVNTVHPTGVNTPMVVNPEFGQYAMDLAELGESMRNPFPVELIDPVDISNAIVFLCSEEGRYITGVTLPVDAGYTIA